MKPGAVECSSCDDRPAAQGLTRHGQPMCWPCVRAHNASDRTPVDPDDHGRESYFEAQIDSGERDRFGRR